MNQAKTSILFLLHLPPPVHGSSMVGQMIVNSQIINNEFNGHNINLLLSRSVDETGKGGVFKTFRFIIVWFRLLKELLGNKPQLCYVALTVSGIAFYKDVLLVAIIRAFGVRIVYHIHNKGVSKKQLHTLYFWLYRFVFKEADVILLSKRLYADIKKFVPINKIHICPNGIAEANPVNVFDKEDKIPCLLFLSNLITSKGVFIFLEACKLLEERQIAFSCNFIGGEGDISASQLNDQIRVWGLGNKVSYLGKKYGEEKNTYWQQADIFALPTYYPNECLPLVLLEAMQYSLPILSTLEGGIPDVVEDGVNGFLVAQGDVIALANKLELLLKDPELRMKMGNAGREKYEEQFTLAIFEQRLTSILKKLTSS